MQRPTLEEMKQQLQNISPVRTKTPPDSLIPPLSAPPRLTQEGMFLGFIIEKDPVRPSRSDSDVERDGGGLSKIRDSGRPSVKEKRTQIKLISTPKGESPGQFIFYDISGSKTVEFYADKRILEATDNGDVVTAVVYDRDPGVGKFNLKSTSTETNSYKMKNEKNYCICLAFKDNQPELVSLREDEIKREDNIMQYLTVFQHGGSAHHDIAIFFSYGDGKKQYNCYLIPQASDTQVSCKVCLKIVDVTKKNADEVRVIHSKYVKFTINPETSIDSTDDAEPIKHHHMLPTNQLEARNGGTLTHSIESSASGGSSDSGQGSSVKDGNGESGEGVGGGDESEISSLEQS